MTIAMRRITGPLIDGLRRATQLRRTRGNVRTAYAVMRRVAAAPALRYVARLSAIDIWRISVADQKPLRRVPQSFTVQKAQATDLPALVEYYGGRHVEDRFRRGDHCWMTVTQGKIGAAIWVATNSRPFDEDWEEMRCLYRVCDGMGWTYDGKGTRWGAWGALMAQLPPQLQLLGIGELYTGIDCNNWQSIDAHRSLGYEHIAVLVHFRVLGLGGTLCRAFGRWHRLDVNVDRLEISRKTSPRSVDPQ